MFLTSAEEIKIGPDITRPSGCATAVACGVEIYLPLKGLIDLNKEIARLNREIEKVSEDLELCKKKLSNENFLTKAKKEVILKEEEKKARLEDQYNKLVESLNLIKA
jgi:valyl-tRNA synthetase